MEDAPAILRKTLKRLKRGGSRSQSRVPHQTKVMKTTEEVVKKDADKLVSSKIEITNLPKSAKELQREGLEQYRKSIKDIGIILKDKAIELSDSNLLSAKLGLWEAMAVVERMMKENKASG